MILDNPQTDSGPYQFFLSGDKVSLLSYHRYKCSLYRIMGPFLGRRIQTSRLETVAAVHRKLTHWRDSLPTYLRHSHINRPLPTSRITMLQKLRLQALALQLAYDNLQIVLHRWVICDKASVSSKVNQAHSQLSLSQLFHSAVRTSELGARENSEVLQECQITHAAMHLGLCLFTAGVVLCAIVLQEPLSERSHKAKHGIRKIVEMHRRGDMGNHVLTAQSIGILEQLVHHVVTVEGNLMLGREPKKASMMDQTSTEAMLDSRPYNSGMIPRNAASPGTLLDSSDITSSELMILLASIAAY